MYSEYLHPFIQKVLSEFNVFCMCSDCVMMNWKETPPSDLQGAKCCFLTIENNSRPKIYRCLCTAYREENVINFRNIQQWWSMFQEGRTNIYNEHRATKHGIRQTVQCVHTFFEDEHCLIFTDMQREMAAHFSHKASKATIVIVLQQTRCKKFACSSTTHRTSKKITQLPYLV